MPHYISSPIAQLARAYRVGTNDPHKEPCQIFARPIVPGDCRPTKLNSDGYSWRLLSRQYENMTMEFLATVLHLAQQELNILSVNNARNQVLAKAIDFCKQSQQYPSYQSSEEEEAKPLGGHNDHNVKSRDSPEIFVQNIGNKSKPTPSLPASDDCSMVASLEQLAVTRLSQHTRFLSQNILGYEWIPSELPCWTQIKLRKLMASPPSSVDGPGYIYALEVTELVGIRVMLKIGMSVEPVKRVRKWKRQCASKKYILQGLYPVPKMVIDYSRERFVLSPAAPWYRRLERLVHVELQGLMALESPTPEIRPSVTKVPCRDCGKVHREIFEFTRFKGSLKGNEWECLVLPVIERWGAFLQKQV